MILRRHNLHNCAQLVEFVDKIGFLPLLSMGVSGWSAQEQVDEDCQYIELPDGGWEWPLWQWKGDVIRETGCAYGKFFDGKAGFISKEFWPDFCNWRRSRLGHFNADSIEAMVLDTLKRHGSLITRELRAACGFTGPKIRSKFDAFITRLEMAGYVVIEDFVYPRSRQGKQYGWGWALLTTPERLFGREACFPDCSPEESYERLAANLQKLFPDAGNEFIRFVLK
ncbi:MAG: hypothetical protein ACI4AH_04745 [Muribaculaceae bacterium]